MQGNTVTATQALNCSTKANSSYDWLALMVATDMTIVLVEENPVQALRVADRTVRMYKGVVEVPAA